MVIITYFYQLTCDKGSAAFFFFVHDRNWVSPFTSIWFRSVHTSQIWTKFISWALTWTWPSLSGLSRATLYPTASPSFLWTSLWTLTSYRITSTSTAARTSTWVCAWLSPCGCIWTTETLVCCSCSLAWRLSANISYWRPSRGNATALRPGGWESWVAQTLTTSRPSRFVGIWQNTSRGTWRDTVAWSW